MIFLACNEKKAIKSTKKKQNLNKNWKIDSLIKIWKLLFLDYQQNKTKLKRIQNISLYNNKTKI